MLLLGLQGVGPEQSGAGQNVQPGAVGVETAMNRLAAHWWVEVDTSTTQRSLNILSDF